MIVADGGYNDGGEYFITPSGHNNFMDKMLADARARHEVVNSYFKRYNILKDKYRGDLGWHNVVFGAVVNLVQLRIENNDLDVFQVEVED